ncbi:hypothetical protein FACS1894137_10610 [Spirochaetia bacterium]|nr:hypothetical protein FACS1894137_10610 [Spirochaetia bacterium]
MLVILLSKIAIYADQSGPTLYLKADNQITNKENNIKLPLLNVLKYFFSLAPITSHVDNIANKINTTKYINIPFLC